MGYFIRAQEPPFDCGEVMHSVKRGKNIDEKVLNFHVDRLQTDRKCLFSSMNYNFYL